MADTTVTKVCVKCEEGLTSSILSFTQFIILIQSQEAQPTISNQGRSQKPTEERSSKLSQPQTRVQRGHNKWKQHVSGQLLTGPHHWYLSHDKCLNVIRMLTWDKGKGPTEALYHHANFSIKQTLDQNRSLSNRRHNGCLSSLFHYM